MIMIEMTPDEALAFIKSLKKKVKDVKDKSVKVPGAYAYQTVVEASPFSESHRVAIRISMDNEP